MSCFNCVECKMNEIVNKFLLVSDKFMPEMHLRQPAVFNKNKEQPGFS